MPGETSNRCLGEGRGRPLRRPLAAAAASRLAMAIVAVGPATGSSDVAAATIAVRRRMGLVSSLAGEAYPTPRRADGFAAVVIAADGLWRAEWQQAAGQRHRRTSMFILGVNGTAANPHGLARPSEAGRWGCPNGNRM